MPPSQADLLRTATLEAGAAVTSPWRWKTCVEAIAQAVNGAGAALFHPRPAPARGEIVCVGIMDGPQATYFGEKIHIDPWNAAQRVKGIFRQAGEVLFGSEFLSDAAVCRTDYYLDHGRYTGSGHKLAMKLLDGRDPLFPATHLVIGRPFSQEPFTDANKAFVGQVYLRLRPAVERFIQLRDALALRELGETALVHNKNPTFVLRPDGLIDYFNPAADAIINPARSWLGLHNGRLTRLGNLDATAVQHAIALARGNGPGASIAFVYQGAGTQPCAGCLHTSPIVDAPVFTGAWPHAEVLLTLNLSLETQPADWVDRLPDLTKQERQVLRLLAAERLPKEIASALDISLGTVRKHLANMNKKTHCRGQRELVRYARTGVPPR